MVVNMIKGVNKQIVEINYTKNDYIEKAILIINPSKAEVPKDIISRKANEYMKTITTQDSPVKSKKIGSSKKAAYFGISFTLLILSLAAIFLFFL